MLSDSRLISAVDRLEKRTLFSSIFGSVHSFPTTGAAAEQIVTADFNHDGKPDVAIGNYNDGTVSIFLNQGKGSFKLVNKLSFGTADPNVSDVVVGDFNGDGKPDLAIVGNDLAVALGTGNGQFATAVHYSAGVSPQDMVVGNFVTGGKLDIAVTDVIGDAVLIFKNDGTGKFGTATSIGGIPGAAGIVSGDFNGDGKIDLAVTSFGHVSFNSGGGLITGPTDGVRLLWGTGSGAFSFGNKFKVYGDHPTEIAAADLTGDNKLDLITTDGGLGGLIGTPTASVLQNYGGGHFAYPRVLKTGNSPQFISVGKLNGKTEIVTADELGNDISLFTPTATKFSYSPAIEILGVSKPVSALLIDVNSDGIPDLLTDSNDGNTLDVLLGL